LHNFQAEQHGKEEFVLFEEGSADSCVEKVLKLINDISAAGFLAMTRFLDGFLVKVDIEFKRPRVGRLDEIQVEDNEVEVGNSFGNFFIEHPGHVEDFSILFLLVKFFLYFDAFEL
jgi:hypothetical protein